MTNIIKSHGFSFMVEQSGFLASDAMDDFYIVCENLEKALDDLSTEDVAKIHKAVTFPDSLDSPAFMQFDSMVYEATNAVTKKWYNPSAAFIMVSAY